MNDPSSRYAEITSLTLCIPITTSETSEIVVSCEFLSTFEDIHYDDIAKVLQISAHKASQLSQRFRQIMTTPLEEAYARAHIFPIPFYHPYFPAQLFEISSPPTVLYVKGQYSLLTNKNR